VFAAPLEVPLLAPDRPLETVLDPTVTFDTSPEHYRHWKLAVDGRVATLTLDIDEDGGIRPGYKLKLNSYDLGVDIELNDALQRIRFEHPSVATVVITSGKDRMFCAGANIYMLGTSSHAWKVNFCKFTNETRNGMEDSSRHDGLKFVAALNGVTAGGGYEVALACDEILMIDDRSSNVSLPEVPLLGVLPARAVSRASSTSAACGATSPTSSRPTPTAYVPLGRRNGDSSIISHPRRALPNSSRNVRPRSPRIPRVPPMRPVSRSARSRARSIPPATATITWT